MSTFSGFSAEEVLRRIEDRAAMLRYWADAGARHETPPPADALSGLADALGDIGALVAAMRAALPVRGTVRKAA